MTSHAAPASSTLSQAFSHTGICHRPQSYSVLLPPPHCPSLVLCYTHLVHVVPNLSGRSSVGCSSVLSPTLPVVSNTVCTPFLCRSPLYLNLALTRSLCYPHNSPHYSYTPSQNCALKCHHFILTPAICHPKTGS